MSIEDKVRMLLDEIGDEDSCFVVPTPFISRPASTVPPPLHNAAADEKFAASFMSARPIEKRRVLSSQQTADLVNRLSRARQVPETSSSSAPSLQRTLMNPNSVRMTRGLEPIDVRSAKLLKAKEKRLEQLIKEKELAERSAVTGHPEINPKSRIIAQRLTPEDRLRIVEERRKILQQEQEAKESFDFHPRINSASLRFAQRRNLNSPSVVDRLFRDVDARKERHEQHVLEHDSVVMANCRPVPFITSTAKSLGIKNSMPPVHERLYPRPTKENEPGDVNTSFVIEAAEPVRSKSVDSTRRRSEVVANSVSFTEFLHGYPRIAPDKLFQDSSAMNLSGVFALTRR